ncbi:MAG: ammonium transporter [Pseudomonas sp.]
MEDIVQIKYALDTFYFLVCAVLVMWMACGFAMLEAGLVRTKSTAEILAKNISLFAIASVMYLLVGYYIMYSSDGSVFPSLGMLIGGENSVAGVMAGGEDAPYYSSRADFFFQIVFAGACMSIVSGAVAERMRLWAFLGFAVIMTGFIYPIQGAWSWGSGWLSDLGYSDYAGSGIVHMAGAAAALAGVLLLGARKGKYGPDGQINAIPGSNMPLSTLGIFILWMGWFGFNGGSELKISDIDSANNVAQVMVNTNLSAAGGLLAAMLVSRLLFGKTDLTMVLNGALAGLVSITADPLSPSALSAVLIGAVGGAIVVFSVLALDRLKIDDPAGAISAHGSAGIWGVLAVPLTNAEAAFTSQLIGVLAIFGWVFLASLLVWGIIKVIIGIRVSPEEEYLGVDAVECGLEAYPEFTLKK